MPELNLAEEGLELLFGTRDENLRRIETAFGVERRGARQPCVGRGELELPCTPSRVCSEQLSLLIERGYQLRNEDVTTAIRVIREAPETSLVEFFSARLQPRGPRRPAG